MKIGDEITVKRIDRDLYSFTIPEGDFMGKPALIIVHLTAAIFGTKSLEELQEMFPTKSGEGHAA